MFRGNTNYSFDEWDDLASVRESKDVRLSSFKTPANSGQSKDHEGDSSSKAAEGSKKVAEEEEDEFKVPTRCIIIEPVMIMLFMFHMSSLMLLNGQYTYYAIGEKYNLSALLAAEKEAEGNGPNGTSKPDGDGGGGVCGGAAEGNRNSTAYEAQQKAQAETAMFNFYMDLVSDIPGLVFILFFGALMDHIGRRPALIIPMIGVILRAAIYPIQMVTGAPIEILFLGGIFEALTGGGMTVTGAAFAYYADTIPPHKRGRRMLISDVTFGTAMALMTFLLGLMIEAWGYFWSFIFVIGGHTLNLIYIIFLVPESRKASKKKIPILRAPLLVFKSFKVLIKKREFSGRKLLLTFAAAWVLVSFGRSGLRHVDQLYKLNSPFCWAPSMISTYTSVTFLVYMLSQLIIGMVLAKPLGNTIIILIALTSVVAQNVLTGVATNTLMIWIAGFSGFAGNCQIPVMRALFSRLVEAGEQGSLNSSLSAMDKVAGLISSFLFNFIYSSTLHFYKGLVFLVAAGVMITAMVIVILFRIMAGRTAKKSGINLEANVKPPRDMDNEPKL